jgi:hypothetical protein
MQLQMHATGADVAFLGQWTLNNGTALHKVQYSREFMTAASRFLQHLFVRFLCQGQDVSDVQLPTFNMAANDLELRPLWETVMHCLADVVAEVKDLVLPGMAKADPAPGRSLKCRFAELELYEV